MIERRMVVAAALKSGCDSACFTPQYEFHDRGLTSFHRYLIRPCRQYRPLFPKIVAPMDTRVKTSIARALAAA